MDTNLLETEGSPSSFMHALTPRVLVGTRALAQLQRVLANATRIVGFEDETHVPVLPAGRTGRRLPLGFIYNPTLLDDDDEDGAIVKARANQLQLPKDPPTLSTTLCPPWLSLVEPADWWPGAQVSTYSYCGLGSTGVSRTNRQGAFWGGKALASLKAAYADAPHWRGTFLSSTPSVYAPWHLPQLPAPTVAQDRWTAWVQRGRLRAVLPWTEDPRAFRLRGHAHMIFSRKNLNYYKKVWLARLEPTYREVYLNFSRSSAHENNWVPIPHGDELYALHTICDQSRRGESLVLRCDPRSGHCKRAFSSSPSPFSSSDASGAAMVCPSGLRGGSPLVQLGKTSLVGMAHRTLTQRRSGGTDRKYLHYLYRLEAQPPFQLLNVSAAFSFPPWFNSSLDDIQFGAGLARRGADSLALSFGVGDCAALEVRVPVERVRAWVGG